MGAWYFSYDQLNRLTTAVASPAVGGNSSFGWSYDSFGNRTLQSALGTTLTTTWAHYTVDGTANTPGNGQNHLTASSSAQGGYTYDYAGDVTYDGGNQYVYDAEGRICAAYQVPIAGVTSGWTGYLYDAAGNRVAKGTLSNVTAGNACDITSNGFTPEAGYVVGPSGEQLTEVDGSGNWKHTNVYAGGKLIGTYDGNVNAPTLHLYIDDPLGTRRVQVADATKTVEATYQSLPFGDGLTTVPGPAYTGDDPTENHFTGKERDTESGNDYMFARYYNSATGRFLSPDWSAEEDPVPYAKLGYPQTLNLYAYVGNNPMGVIDMTGHDGCYADGMPTDCSLLNSENSVEDPSDSDQIADEMLGFAQTVAKQRTHKPGRQPDGSYIAPTGPGSEIYKRLHGQMKNGPIGSGECVDACRFFSDAPNSDSWVAGTHALSLTDADIGTAIATFDSSGHYPSNSDPLGKNSGIYMGRDAFGGIMIVDQWPVGDGPPGTHQPFLHTIPNYAPNNNVHPLRSNNADAYYVILAP